jgi:hypothetical protein
LRKLSNSLLFVGEFKSATLLRSVVTVPVEPLRDHLEVALGFEILNGPVKVIAFDC